MYVFFAWNGLVASANEHAVFFNPFAPTRRKTVTHFRRFFTVLEYSPIGVKFPPITAPRTLHCKEKKFGKFSIHF
jgi:hypothetical protein